MLCKPNSTQPKWDFLAEPEPKIFGLSGGPDSLALLVHLRSTLADFPAGGPVIAVTVDHGYRAGSDTEAEAAAEMARSLGFTALVRRRDTPLPPGNLQAYFRSLRREILFDVALEMRAKRIILAHHQDDQIETYLLRLAHGSGDWGLAGMQLETPWRHLLVTRPALEMPQTDLHQTLKSVPLKPLLDPSNQQMKFDRVRIREALAEEADEGRRLRMIADIARYQQDRCAAANRLRSLATAALRFPYGGAVIWESDKAKTAPEALQLRLLEQVLCAVSGREMPLRQVKLRRLLARISERVSGRQTLGGAEVTIQQNHARFVRERGRVSVESKPALPGKTIWWDNRFLIEFAHSIPQGLEIGALTQEGLLRLMRDPSHSKEASLLPPSREAIILPALKGQKNSCLALPALGWAAPELRDKLKLSWPAGNRLGFCP